MPNGVIEIGQSPEVAAPVVPPGPKTRVYFIRAVESGKIKIGFTSKLPERFTSIMTSCPEPVELLGSIAGTLADEQALHVRFAHIRHVGEWFRGEHDLLDFIRENCG